MEMCRYLFRYTLMPLVLLGGFMNVVTYALESAPFVGRIDPFWTVCGGIPTEREEGRFIPLKGDIHLCYHRAPNLEVPFTPRLRTLANQRLEYYYWKPGEGGIKRVWEDQPALGSLVYTNFPDGIERLVGCIKEGGQVSKLGNTKIDASIIKKALHIEPRRVVETPFGVVPVPPLSSEEEATEDEGCISREWILPEELTLPILSFAGAKYARPVCKTFSRICGAQDKSVRIQNYGGVLRYCQNEQYQATKVIIDYPITAVELTQLLDVNPKITDLELTQCENVINYFDANPRKLKSLILGLHVGVRTPYNLSAVPQNISKVVIEYRVNQEELQSFLDSHPMIQYLEIEDCKEVAGFIGGNPHVFNFLKSLVLGICFRQEELSNFPDFQSPLISKVTFGSLCNVSDQVLEKVVQNYPNLMSLYLYEYSNAGGQGFNCLVNAKNLTELKVEKCYNTDGRDLDTIIQSCPNLVSLALPLSCTWNSNATSLSDLESLSRLSLTNSSCESRYHKPDFNEISKLRFLTHLDLGNQAYGLNPSNRSGGGRGRSATVVRNYFRKAQQTAPVQNSFSATDILGKFIIEDKTVLIIQDTDLKCLSSLRYFTSLNLFGASEITDAGLAHLPNSLTVLDLSYCRNITDEGIKELMGRCKALCKLDLRGCTGLTKEGLKHILANGCALTSLCLHMCEEIPVEELKPLLRGLPHLESITLPNGEKLDDSKLKAYLSE